MIMAITKSGILIHYKTHEN